MSLDVFLTQETNGLYPDEEALTPNKTVYRGNITHNLNDMADNVILSNGKTLYDYLWCPDENNVKKGKDLILVLTQGLAELINNPDKYKQYNPSNGWGTYQGLVKFLVNYLKACIEFPQATVYIWK